MNAPELSYLGLVEDFLRNLARENLWWTSALEHLVLTKGEIALKSVLGEGEAQDELLPWEQWPVQGAGEALNYFSPVLSYKMGSIT